MANGDKDGKAPMTKAKRLWFAALALAGVAVVAVAGGAVYLKQSSAPFVAGGQTTETDPAQLAGLEGHRIFFGHQSVGRNILEGVHALEANERAGLPIVTVEEPGALGSLQGGYIANAVIGKNGDPASKFKAFNDYMRSGVGDQVDVALMKLCYLDLKATANPHEIFREYRDTMQTLEADYPNVKFIYTTVPLTTDAGFKSSYKNTLRTEFNSLVRSQLADKRVFDIAYLETASPEGASEPQSLLGFSYESLRPEYSSDGSHLNAAGKERAAHAFIAELSRTIDGAQH